MKHAIALAAGTVLGAAVFFGVIYAGMSQFIEDTSPVFLQNS